jgi:two-component system, OmpR family, alkaline phosphatase synthesis response regulator PhoP
MPVHTILVAEDDGAIRDLLSHHLEREGFGVVGAADGHAALRGARGAADLVILDVGLPGLDGFDVARAIRREKLAVPIVMLTARAEEIDRVIGFELGADDYVTKPFSPREVVARVKAVLRRTNASAAEASRTMAFGRLEIDERAREVRVDGVCVKLTPREFALLRELAGNPGVAFSREKLLQKVWGFDYAGDERTVDVHIRRLRAAIEEPWKLHGTFSTVRGYGYKFVRP